MIRMTSTIIYPQHISLKEKKKKKKTCGRHGFEMPLTGRETRVTKLILMVFFFPVPSLILSLPREFVHAVFPSHPFILQLFWLVAVAVAGITSMLALRFQHKQISSSLAFLARVSATSFLLLTINYFMSDGIAAAGERIAFLGNDMIFMAVLLTTLVTSVLTQVYFGGA
ncbi:hypothetical protein Tsubulata_018521 [Turnera subulata]|uniref:Uncharacterized protein n=1 Tax=Turnera subulata TaxID=218843 RepID=A0A9Q0GGC7_9ROSI|nr:hypothetical protein Tsubulata_018521 [Turnera subulata]